jgi:predicted MFS family arabinose efflux permease
VPPEPPVSASGRSQRGLDWFAFCVADVQTGFGPFISVYLTAQGWTQVDIGLVLTARGLAGLVLQMPGGAIVDAARSERAVAAVAMIAISVSALIIALWPMFPAVFGAQILQAAGSSVVSPALAAISLGLVGHAASGERFGRNARFASIGTALAAAGMGVVGYFWSTQAVFLVTAALIVPTLITLAHIPPNEIDPVRAHGGVVQGRTRTAGLASLLTNRPLLIFAACVTCFQLANTAMLPLMASIITMRSSAWATTLVAACIVVALFSPAVGRLAQRLGRRPILLIGFAALPIRALLFVVVTDPRLLVAVQVLDGVCAAVFGVLVPLTIADVTRGTGRFNLAQGIVGSATGVGASLSTTLAGWMSDRLGSSAAFLGLACVGGAGLILTWLLMPETAERKAGPRLLPSPRR